MVPRGFCCVGIAAHPAPHATRQVSTNQSIPVLEKADAPCTRAKTTVERVRARGVAEGWLWGKCAVRVRRAVRRA